MNTITIPRGFVVLPRAEYEELRARPSVREIKPTKAVLQALARMHKSRAAGKMVSLDVLERDLASRG